MLSSLPFYGLTRISGDPYTFEHFELVGAKIEAQLPDSSWEARLGRMVVIGNTQGQGGVGHETTLRSGMAGDRSFLSG